MPLGIRPTVDFVFKLLFGSLENTDLLIHLLNAVLKPESPIEEVEILNPYNDKMFEDDKLSIVDVKARDSSGAWYVIEVQTTIPVELRNRLVFYTAELFSRQMNEAPRTGNSARQSVSASSLNRYSGRWSLALAVLPVRRSPFTGFRRSNPTTLDSIVEVSC
ncbi:Rpn family recombination-promoting nuclease/putative transposase [Roseiconus lacunae]|uniref:Rpn family recombination-promoting nuclease/putative transposase n=1 Tax=Roseiconus lacunae TaxID=2605694 RepID=UPI0021BCDD11|nr:Rpn family recombination-promoting nuclease/putative transposase [Roseiconus lacunae]